MTDLGVAPTYTDVTGKPQQADGVFGALTTALTGGSYLIPSGASLKLTYVVAPSLNVVRLT